MALVVWNQNLSVNINSIDEQHKKLIGMLNEFYDHIADRSNKENISKLLDSMKKYTIEHFTYEETIMKKHEYPMFDSHKKEHDKFVARVNDLQERFTAGRLVLSLEVTSFLLDWLKKHIQVIDKQYSDFLVEKGVK